MTGGERIGPLSGASLAEAGAVLDAAFGRAGMTGNLQLAHFLQPESWLCARRDGAILALVGAFNYGPFASIGMMAVHPAAQRQGVGERLMAALIDLLAARGCPVLILDASEAGQHLYPRLGFAGEGETLRMAPDGPARFGSEAALPEDHAAAPAVSVIGERELAEVAAFDAPLFGADRSVALQAYWRVAPERAFVARDDRGRIGGYILSNAAHIGPWTASSAAAGEHLLRATLRLPFHRAPFLTVPDANAAAVAMLTRYGFVVTERLLHMRRGGAADPRQTQFLYGQASLTLG